MEGKNLPVLHSQAHCCWCPGPRLNIKTVFPRYGDSRLAYSSALGGSLPHFKANFRPPAFSQNLPLSIKIWSTCVSGLDSDATGLVIDQLPWSQQSILPLISWGSVKTETLPALCNKNNKPIDLIHLRCGWQLHTPQDRKGIYGVSGKCSPPTFVSRKCVFPKHALFKNRRGLRLSY